MGGGLRCELSDVTSGSEGRECRPARTVSASSARTNPCAFHPRSWQAVPSLSCELIAISGRVRKLAEGRSLRSLRPLCELFVPAHRLTLAGTLLAFRELIGLSAVLRLIDSRLAEIFRLSANRVVASFSPKGSSPVTLARPLLSFLRISECSRSECRLCDVSFLCAATAVPPET